MTITKFVKKEVDKISMDNDVILFGSRARGDFKKDSDWDFLILLKDDIITDLQKENIRDKLYDIELENEQIISSIIFTKTEWEKRAVTPLYQIIKEEGIEVGELFEG